MKMRHVFAAALLLCAGHAVAQQPLYKQANAPIEERIKDLMERMTVEEKAKRFIELANENGGKDNVSVILIHR